MASIKDYGLDATAIEEWVPWGGLTRPSVMRQKDGSMFSVLAYKELDGMPKKHIGQRDFRRGWSMWLELQSMPNREMQNYLVVCWNPFLVKEREGTWMNPFRPLLPTKALNAFRPGIRVQEALDWFVAEVDQLAEEMQGFTEVRVLEYQELLDYVSFTVNHGKDFPSMPDVPLYLDAYLTQDNEFEFRTNDIYINGERLLVCSLFGMPDMGTVHGMIKNIPFRHVRRLLFFDRKEAEADFKRYTSKWFHARKNMRDLAVGDILNEHNGYWNEWLLVLLDEENDDPFREYLSALLDEEGISYLFESFNLKEAFWGSLPGLFLAGAHPPMVGVQHLDSLLAGAKEDKEMMNRFHILNTLSGKDRDGKALDASKIKFAGEDGEEISADEANKREGEDLNVSD